MMKSADGKKRWREFIESYKDKVKDYNFGSLIRTDCRDEYAETNTIFGASPLCFPCSQHHRSLYYCSHTYAGEQVLETIICKGALITEAYYKFCAFEVKC